MSSVTSNFPGEGAVTYQYRGDGKRHRWTAGGVTTKYGWDIGWNVMHEESAGGTLQKSYVMSSPQAKVGRILADMAGTNPATGTARYYAHDHLGSTRGLYSTAGAFLGSYDYAPYGSTYRTWGASISTLGGAFSDVPIANASSCFMAGISGRLHL